MIVIATSTMATWGRMAESRGQRVPPVSATRKNLRCLGRESRKRPPRRPRRGESKHPEQRPEHAVLSTGRAVTVPVMRAAGSMWTFFAARTLSAGSRDLRVRPDTKRSPGDLDIAADYAIHVTDPPEARRPAARPPDLNIPAEEIRIRCTTAAESRVTLPPRNGWRSDRRVPSRGSRRPRRGATHGSVRQSSASRQLRDSHRRPTPEDITSPPARMASPGTLSPSGPTDPARSHHRRGA